MRHEVISDKSSPAHGWFGILHFQSVPGKDTPEGTGAGKHIPKGQSLEGQGWAEVGQVNWRHFDNPQGTTRDTQEAKLENGAATES